VLAVGHSAAFAAAGVTLPVEIFDARTALGTAAKLHPIVSLTALTPLLDPSIRDPRS